MEKSAARAISKIHQQELLFEPFLQAGTRCLSHRLRGIGTWLRNVSQ